MCALVKINYFSNIRKIVNFFFLYFDLFFRGKVVCDNILCPNPTCAQPFLPEGECCPICNNTVKAIQPGKKKEWNWFDEKKIYFYISRKKLPNLEICLFFSGSGCHLEGDPVFHSPGSRWHPYIPPHGFSRCATCTCLVIDNFLFISMHLFKQNLKKNKIVISFSKWHFYRLIH